MIHPLTSTEFSTVFETFESSAFRLETLPEYAVSEEADEFKRFLEGEPLSVQKNGDWCDFLESSVAAGKSISRVRILPAPLTPYVRFEIDWGYVFSATAGESISLIQRHTADALRLDLAGDAWLFDNATLVQMKYSDTGSFIGGYLDDNVKRIESFCAVRDTLLRHATPLKEYLRQQRSAS